MGATEPGVDAATVTAELTTFVVDTLEALVERHAPSFRLPGTFGGHLVGSDARADLAFTLAHLHDAGVASVAGTAVPAAVAVVLAGLDGERTHTFFSYRVAESLARWGPWDANALVEAWDEPTRRNVASACDSSSWIALLDEPGLLPRNYAAVLARCELARHDLGLPAEVATLDALVERVGALLAANPGRHLDDSTHGIGRYDIYSADVWLFTEPLAGRLGPLWEEGLVAALDLVDRVGDDGGAAITWGRSTGVLATALTIELGALATTRGASDPWLGRVAAAAATLPTWFAAGVVTAHQHRSPYAYRGPARRLQLTLDVLGKLAWAAAALGRAPTGHAPARPARPPGDALIRFDDRAAVWAHRDGGGVAPVVPFVGATRSDYLAAPRQPGLYEVPVDRDLPCWVPLVVASDHRWTLGGVPASLAHDPGRVTATWDGLVRAGDLDPEPEAPRLAGAGTVTYRAEGRSLSLDLSLDLAERPQAITVLVPEVADRPLRVEADGGRLDRVDVDGIDEWRSFWSTLPVVHQVDMPAERRTRSSIRVTPLLRVASSAHGHHYDRSLYGPLADRVLELPPPIGAFARRRDRIDHLDLFHLHWPEWLALDDPTAHDAAIEALTVRAVPVVWTAHNLTPHDKDPTTYDPIYARWAATADAVIHHSAWGAARMRERYRFRGDCRHVVIPHGHFGELWAQARTLDRRATEAALGLPPAGLRVGLVGAPRAEKDVQAFLDGFAASTRPDLQLACWSLGDETVPADARIAVAEPYRMVDERTYAARLAVCDVLAMPFDPDGEMLATGTAADAVGLGLPVLASAWGYLTETLGGGAIACPLDPAGIAAVLDGLDDDDLAAARTALEPVRRATAWDLVAERTYELFDEVARSR